MSQEPIEFVSVIGVNLLWPIARELGVLGAADAVRPNNLQTNASENGHAIAVVLLAVITLESAIGRSGFVHENRELRGKFVEGATRYVRQKVKDHFCGESDCPAKTFDTTAVDEAFVVRDAIAHNHLWSGKFIYDEDAGVWTTKREPTPLPGFGDDKFMANADLGTGETKVLKLNVVPTRVWSRDAYIVLRTLLETLEVLDHVGGKPLGIQGHPVILDGKAVGYEKFAKYVCDRAAEFA